jgi:hypothetical protein
MPLCIITVTFFSMSDSSAERREEGTTFYEKDKLEYGIDIPLLS